MRQKNSTDAPTAEQEWTVNDMRLGDLDALKKILFNDTQYGFWHDSMDGSDVAYTQRDLFKCIDAMPTIDAVPVVRCDECERRNKSADLTDSVYCPWLKLQMRKTDFCSYGERKDGDGE